MANTLRIKRSTGSSAPMSLENAELAFAEGNEILYIGKGTGGAGGSATTINAIGGKGKFIDVDTSRTQTMFLLLRVVVTVVLVLGLWLPEIYLLYHIQK